MPMPVRSLPVLQNWDCHSCTDCCHEYRVGVTDAERERVEQQGWRDDPTMKGVELFAPEGPRRANRWRLNQGESGGCVFLDEKGGCRIHAKFGSAAKPLACRIYPFVLVPAGDQWRVGFRFACPSVAKNQGRPSGEHSIDVREYAKLLEAQEGITGSNLPVPPLQPGQSVAWPDLLLFGQGVQGILKQSDEPVQRRLRKCLAFAKICRLAKFDKLSGKRLAEFINLVGAGLDGEVADDPATLPQPSWIGRILFRQVLALYARKDTGRNRGVSKYGRLALLRAAWRFAIGTGTVPQVHGLMRSATFAGLDQPLGPISELSERLLERYYRVKVESLQFFGPSNFGLPFWDGLESLVLTYPAIVWLARALDGPSPDDNMMTAVRIVDDNFGFNPLLGLKRQRFGLRTLARRGELAKLVAWYSR
jgi:lysine-N-methylase